MLCRGCLPLHLMENSGGEADPARGPKSVRREDQQQKQTNLKVDTPRK